MGRTLRRMAALSALTLVPVGALAAERNGYDVDAVGASVGAGAVSAWQGVQGQVQQYFPDVPSLRDALAQGNSGSSGDGLWGGQSGSQADGSGDTRTASAPEVTGVPIDSQPGAVMVRTVLPGGEGAGSGIVWKSNGTILTNYHVVKGSTQIQITTADGSTHTADMVGYSQGKDIAVLKIRDSVNLTAAKFDTSPEQGEAVSAVGQGGGRGVLYKASGRVTALGQSITASDKEADASGASGSSAEKLSGLIRTDAPIVSGYSGGPLFDSDGEVIGIDTAASATTPIVGFAIPSANLLDVAQQIASGKTSGDIHLGRHAALGVQVSADTANSSGDTAVASDGVQVDAVVGDGAAAKAGVEAGAVITSVDGQKVSSFSALTSVLSAHAPGDVVGLTWLSADGSSHSSKVTLGAAAQN